MVFLCFITAFNSLRLVFLHIFPMLKARAKKAKSILTLSFPKCLNLLLALLYFVCPKTASGSMHLRPRRLMPSSEVSSSRAFCLLLLSGKNKLKALYPFIHRCCSRFTYSWAWFSVLNYKHYKMCLF